MKDSFLKDWGIFIVFQIFSYALAKALEIIFSTQDIFNDTDILVPMTDVTFNGCYQELLKLTITRKFWFYTWVTNFMIIVVLAFELSNTQHTIFLLFMLFIIPNLISRTWKNFEGTEDTNAPVLRWMGAGNHRVARLTNKRVLIVGGTKGIGRALAESLCYQGCSVTIVGRSKEEGLSFVQKLNEISTTVRSTGTVKGKQGSCQASMFGFTNLHHWNDRKECSHDNKGRSGYRIRCEFLIEVCH